MTILAHARSAFRMALISSLTLSGFGAARASIIPIDSTGVLGPLTVATGILSFDTDPADPTFGGTYAINGVMQPGHARIVTLPPDTSYAPGNGTGSPTSFNVFVWDFSTITLGSSVGV